VRRLRRAARERLQQRAFVAQRRRRLRAAPGNDPHVQERGIVVEAPDEDMGEVPMHAIVPRLSGTPGRLRRPAPAVGQHTHEIFSRIGYSDERIAALAQKGVI